VHPRPSEQHPTQSPVHSPHSSLLIPINVVIVVTWRLRDMLTRDKCGACLSILRLSLVHTQNCSLIHVMVRWRKIGLTANTFCNLLMSFPAFWRSIEVCSVCLPSKKFMNFWHKAHKFSDLRTIDAGLNRLPARNRSQTVGTMELHQIVGFWAIVG